MEHLSHKAAHFTLSLLVESANNQKLMLEYEKFQEQQAKMMKMQEEYDRQISEMEEARQRSLGELTEYYETKIQEMTTKLEQVSFFCLVCKDLNLYHSMGIFNK